MPRFLLPLLSLVASAASALTFTTNFPRTTAPATLLAAPAGGNVVYALSQGTLYRSADAGTTFEPRAEKLNAVVVDPSNPDILYSNLARSADGGATWTPFGSGLPPSLAASKLIVNPETPSELYAGFNCPPRSTGHFNDGGVYRSTDRGATWSHLFFACVEDMALHAPSDHVYVRDANWHLPAVLPNHQIVKQFALGWDDAAHTMVGLKTIDGGATWQPMALTGATGTPRQLAFDDVSGRLYLSTSEGLFVKPYVTVDQWFGLVAGPVESIAAGRSNLYFDVADGAFRMPLDGSGARAALAPLPTAATAVRGIAADPITGVLYATSDGAIRRSGDSGASWQLWSGNAGAVRQIAVDAAGDVYAAQATSPYYDLITLVHIRNGASELIPTPVPSQYEQQLAASPRRPGYLYVTSNAGLFASLDGGHSWLKTLPDVVSSIAMENDTVYAATGSGTFVSLDAGLTWRQLDATRAWKIAVAASRPATLYRLTYDALERSDDGGVTWRSVVQPSGMFPRLGTIAVDPLDAESIWYASALNLYHSLDGGATWSEEIGNLPVAPYGAVQDILIDRDGRRMHVVLDPLRSPGEWDATIRGERRRAARR